MLWVSWQRTVQSYAAAGVTACVARGGRVFWPKRRFLPQNRTPLLERWPGHFPKWTQLLSRQRVFQRKRGLCACEHGPFALEHGLLSRQHGLFTCEHGLFTCEHGLFTCEHGLFTREHGLFTCEHGPFTREHGLFTREHVVFWPKQAPLWSGQAPRRQERSPLCGTQAPLLEMTLLFYTGRLLPGTGAPRGPARRFLLCGRRRRFRPGGGYAAARPSSPQ